MVLSTLGLDKGTVGGNCVLLSDVDADDDDGGVDVEVGIDVFGLVFGTDGTTGVSSGVDCKSVLEFSDDESSVWFLFGLVLGI